MNRRSARLAFLLAAIAIPVGGCAQWESIGARRERDGMVDVPGGPFLIGCNDSECYPGESAQQTVSLPPFSIDRTEVTIAAYRECVRAGACTEPGSEGNWARPGHDQHPVDSVDREQAAAYCRWKGKRLPTDPEWEKAARGTDGRRFPWGNDPPTCDHAVLAECGAEAQPVGGRAAGASPYGALDMAGNVWEWTADADADGKGGARGGSWKNHPRGARSSGRASVELGKRELIVGFRCAR